MPSATQSKSSLIREALTKDPQVKPVELAKKLGVDPQSVYQVRHSLKKAPRFPKGHKLRADAIRKQADENGKPAKPAKAKPVKAKGTRRKKRAGRGEAANAKAFQIFQRRNDDAQAVAEIVRQIGAERAKAALDYVLKNWDQ